jgi:hypothetical protein
MERRNKLFGMSISTHSEKMFPPEILRKTWEAEI